MVMALSEDMLSVPLVPVKEEADEERTASTSPSILQQWTARLDERFSITKRGSTLSVECQAGTTAFLACSNNFIVNAHIMQHAGIDPAVSIVSGAFAASVTCISSGLLSNLPLGIVPSVGPNVFLAFSLVAARLVSVEGALAISTASGLLLFMLSLTPVLKLVLALMPLSIKYGLIIGTGLLTSFIGLKSIGVVVADTGPAHDIVALGNLDDIQVWISAIFLLITSTLVFHGIKGAVLGGMLGATLTYWACSGNWPSSLVAIKFLTPHNIDFSVLTSSHVWVQVGALLLMLLFSISGAVIGCARMAGVLREDGSVPGRNAVYVCCGVGTIISAALGSAPMVVSMSAAAGIREGGRTGFVSVVVGIYSLLTAFLFTPLAAAIPPCAVAPVLVLVGLSMLGEAKEVKWWSMIDALPAFLCAVFQPFTYSVSNGIYAGIAASFMLFFTTGEFLSYLPGRTTAQTEHTPGTPYSVNAFHRGDSGRPSLLASTPEVSPSHRARRALVTLTPDGSPRYRTTCEEKGTVSEIGARSRRQAMSLIEKSCSVLGLDKDAIMKVVEERMQGGGRCAEENFFGGISGRVAARRGFSCKSIDQQALLWPDTDWNRTHSM